MGYTNESLKGRMTASTDHAGWRLIGSKKAENDWTTVMMTELSMGKW